MLPQMGLIEDRVHVLRNNDQVEDSTRRSSYSGGRRLVTATTSISAYGCLWSAVELLDHTNPQRAGYAYALA